MERGNVGPVYGTCVIPTKVQKILDHEGRQTATDEHQPSTAHRTQAACRARVSLQARTRALPLARQRACSPIQIAQFLPECTKSPGDLHDSLAAATAAAAASGWSSAFLIGCLQPGHLPRTPPHPPPTRKHQFAAGFDELSGVRVFLLCSAFGEFCMQGMGPITEATRA